MDALVQRQNDLISRLGRVDEIGKSSPMNSATAELLASVKQQVSGIATMRHKYMNNVKCHRSDYCFHPLYLFTACGGPG